MNLLFCGQVM
uniref:Uncharacterized protein n=1 Tax=Anguilla anguilla TaxID=7936 RepID=A0A0E9TDL7_ANGAN